MGLFSKRLIPTSSVMPFDEAQAIVAKFGDSVIELSEFKSRQMKQHGVSLNPPLLYSLPVERLHHTKWQIQIALAVAVAELVIRSKTVASNQITSILMAMCTTCQELAWFSRKPVFIPLKETDSIGLLNNDGADGVYMWWKELCERCLKAGAGEPGSVAAWPSEQALIQYWQDVDHNLSVLLNRPLLVAIRET